MAYVDLNATRYDAVPKMRCRCLNSLVEDSLLLSHSKKRRAIGRNQCHGPDRHLPGLQQQANKPDMNRDNFDTAHGANPDAIYLSNFFEHDSTASKVPRGQETDAQQVTLPSEYGLLSIKKGKTKPPKDDRSNAAFLSTKL